MANIPAAVEKRLKSAVPKFQKILQQKRKQDLNEADTVTIITGMLEQVFGFDKYSDITKEYDIQGNYKCDFAVMVGKKVAYLIEAKQIGARLVDRYINQAANYASREGIRYVVLTNGILWQIHRITWSNKGVQSEMLAELDFLALNPRRKQEDWEHLSLLTKWGVQKDLIDEFYEHTQVFNQYTISALLLTDSMRQSIRRELRKLKPGIKVDIDEIETLMQRDVIKHAVLDNEAFADAKKLIARTARKQKKVSAEKRKSTSDSNETPQKVNPEPVAGNGSAEST